MREFGGIAPWNTQGTVQELRRRPNLRTFSANCNWDLKESRCRIQEIPFNKSRGDQTLVPYQRIAGRDSTGSRSQHKKRDHALVPFPRNPGETWRDHHNRTWEILKNSRRSNQESIPGATCRNYSVNTRNRTCSAKSGCNLKELRSVTRNSLKNSEETKPPNLRCKSREGIEGITH